MQSAATVLGVLRERGRRGLPLERLYRQLFNPHLYLLAYQRIYSNHGAMTPGPCPILDLVLGPLHLDLLGLIVDLNQVHLQITAAPNEGPLGALLCSLSPPPTTTAVTT